VLDARLTLVEVVLERPDRRVEPVLAVRNVECVSQPLPGVATDI